MDQSKENIARRWQPSRLGYRWVVRNIGYLLFLAALAVVYIYNGHYADKISRDLSRTDKELKELQYEYKTLKSEVMFRSKESELAKAVAPFGLVELTQPPSRKGALCRARYCRAGGRAIVAGSCKRRP